MLFSNEKSIVNFLFEDIFTCFGVPREIVADQGSQFTSKMVKGLVEDYKIKHRKPTPYHPQENGQVESTNNVIEGILTKIVHLHRRDWAERPPEALWPTKLHGGTQWDTLPMNLFMGRKS